MKHLSRVMSLLAPIALFFAELPPAWAAPVDQVGARSSITARAVAQAHTYTRAIAARRMAMRRRRTRSSTTCNQASGSTYNGCGDNGSNSNSGSDGSTQGGSDGANNGGGSSGTVTGNGSPGTVTGAGGGGSVAGGGTSVGGTGNAGGVSNPGGVTTTASRAPALIQTPLPCTTTRNGRGRTRSSECSSTGTAAQGNGAKLTAMKATEVQANAATPGRKP